ncbi:MAG: hypothetical protein ABRQ38_26065 [Candidatus Eremiobacterota bacterium]
MDMTSVIFVISMGILLWFGCYACREEKKQVAEVEERNDNFRRM